MTTEQGVKVVPTFKPELASLNAGSINFALFDIPRRMRVDEWKHPWEKAYMEMTKDFIFPNTFKSLEEFARVFKENGAKPEAEIYDTAMINNVAYLVEQGLLEKTKEK